ncbi:unnamed protein product [Brassicogethes aeneus]|uniref:Uncharacterized protein n=1 Tax=Brassicogethes aeneus TaxID=1431903 RepID=A0A9P0FER0_BRAAE|nr:unnamed protein product [Brassicogethes aeneus]
MPKVKRQSLETLRKLAKIRREKKKEAFNLLQIDQVKINKKTKKQVSNQKKTPRKYKKPKKPKFGFIIQIKNHKRLIRRSQRILRNLKKTQETKEKKPKKKTKKIRNKPKKQESRKRQKRKAEEENENLPPSDVVLPLAEKEEEEEVVEHNQNNCLSFKMVYPDKKFENETFQSKSKYKMFKKTKGARGRESFFNNRGGRTDYYGNRNYRNRNTSYYNGRLLPQRKFHHKKPPSRPPSPVVGSEEYTKRKIAETSSKIMKHLMNPNIPLKEKQPEPNQDKTRQTDSNKQVENKSDANSFSKNKSKNNAKEIHDKILNHITGLNKGRKKMFINAKSSTYDIVIQQIQKKKRLELSRIFRRMCAQESTEANNEADELLNSIIPDIGIKIDELPKELIEELRNTLDISFEECYDNEDSNATEILENFDNHSVDLDEPIDNNKIIENEMHQDIESEDNTVGDLLSKSFNKAHFQHEFININENTNDNNENVLHNNTQESVVVDEETISIEQEKIDNMNDSNIEKNKIETLIKQEIMEEDITNNDMNANIFKPNKEPIPFPPIKEEKMKEESQHDITNNESNDNNTETNKEESTEFNIPAMKDSISITENSITENDAKSEDKDCLEQEKHEIKKEFTLEDFFEPEQVSCDSYNKESISSNSVEETSNNSEELLVENNTISIISAIPKSTMQEMSKNLEKNITEETPVQKTTISTQTVVPTAHCYSQTVAMDLFSEIRRRFLKNYNGQLPDTVPDCINVMEDVDKLINNLTNFRKSLFSKFKTESQDKRVEKKRKSNDGNYNNNRERNFKRHRWEQAGSSRGERSKNNYDQSKIRKEVNKPKSPEKVDNIVQQNNAVASINFNFKLLEFPEVTEKVLVTKVIEDSLVITTERGKIHFCSLEDGSFKHTLEVSNMPVTCLDYSKQESRLYVGTFDSVLKIYDFKTKQLIKSEPIDDGVQCIEYRWEYIFMGGRRGFLMRYSEKKEKVEFTDQISKSNVMVLKATQEGARRILLVGSRHAPVCIRDAITGLHMRTLADHISPTVYSLLLERSLVYCGTTAHNVLVFSFNDGSLKDVYNAPNSKGIGGMKIFENLLFASCLNGFIYTYNLKDNQYIGSIKGPGGVILSMEVIKYQIIVSTMSLKFTSIAIPKYILKCISL